MTERGNVIGSENAARRGAEVVTEIATETEKGGEVEARKGKGVAVERDVGARRENTDIRVNLRKETDAALAKVLSGIVLYVFLDLLRSIYFVSMRSN